jgi:hypothetical protein
MKKNALFFIEMIFLRHRYVDSDSVKHFNNSKPCYCQESFIGYNTLPRRKQSLSSRERIVQESKPPPQVAIFVKLNNTSKFLNPPSTFVNSLHECIIVYTVIMF